MSKSDEEHEDDTILTATITFDVTVDKNGQVINTSEGQIISETVDTRGGDIGTSHFGSNQVNQYHQYHNLQPVDGNEVNPIQADSLTSMTENSQRRENKSMLQDSLDEIDGNNGNESEEESTTTESLIERSKKYMDKEAGIIILRRNSEDEAKNFNINLDFDLKDQSTKRRYHNVSTIEEESSQKSDDKDFNIEMDFDLNKKKQSAGKSRDNDFNINMDFDLKNGKARAQQERDEKDFSIDMDFDLKNGEKKKQRAQRGDKDFNIDMDFDVGKRTGLRGENTLNSTLIDQDKSFDIDMDFAGANQVRRFVNVDQDTGVGIDVIVTNNREPNGDDDDERVLYEETIHYQELNDDEVKKINAQPINLEEYLREQEPKLSDMHAADRSKFIMNKKSAANNMESTLANDKAKMDLINRMVEKSLEKGSVIDKEEFYRMNIDKVREFNVDDCIEMLLDGNTKQQAAGESKATTSAQALSSPLATEVPVLRPFETIDFEALTKGFEQEDVKEGKLVLYITEAQLLQLLNQRAIIIPDKNKLLSRLNEDNEEPVSLVDDKIKENLKQQGRQSPVDKVELVIESRSKSRADSDSSKADDSEAKKMCILDIISSVSKLADIPKTESTSSSSHRKNSQELHTVTAKDSVTTTGTATSSTTASTTRAASSAAAVMDTKSYMLGNEKEEEDAPSDVYSGTARTATDFRTSMTENMTSAQVNRLDERVYERTEDFSEMSDRPISDIKDLIQSNSFVDALTERQQIFDELLSESVSDVIMAGLKKENLDDKAYNKIQDLIDHALNDVDPSETNIDRAKVFRDFYDAVSPHGEQERRREASDESIETAISRISGVYDQAHYENYNTERRGPSSEKLLTVLEDFIERVVRTDSKTGKEERALSDSDSNKALGQIKDFALEAIGGSDNLREVILFEQFLDKVFGKETLEELKNKGVEGKAYNLTADLLESICDDGKKVAVTAFKHPALDKGRTFEKFFKYVAQKPENLSLSRVNMADQEEMKGVKTKLGELYDKSLARSGKYSLVMETVAEKNLKFLGDFSERVLDNKKAERLFSDDMSDEGLNVIHQFVLSSLEFESIVDEVSKISSVRSSITSDYRPETKIFDEFLQNVLGTQTLDKMREKGFLPKAYNLIQDLVDYSIFDVISKVKDMESVTERGLIFKNFFENISSRSDEFMSRKRAATDECFQKALTNISSSLANKDIQFQSDLKSEKVLLTLGDFVNRALGTTDRRLSNSQSDLVLSHFRKYVFDCLCEQVSCRETSPTMSAESEKIFDQFLQDIFGRDSLAKMINGNLISTVNNKIQDLIDDAFSAHASGSDAISKRDLEKAQLFKEYISKQGPKYDSDFKRQRIGTDQQVDRALAEVASVFDKSTKLNAADKALSGDGKFLRTLADYIDRRSMHEATSRILTNDLSDEALSKITDYVLHDLFNVITPRPSVVSATKSMKVDRPSLPGEQTIGDNKLISFKNFDLLVPVSDTITSTSASSVEFRTKSTDTSYSGLPKQYEFLNPTTRTNDSRASKAAIKDPRKIVIKTTRKVPPKVCPPAGQQQRKAANCKKRINFSYLEDYVPSTRIYELLDDEREGMDQATRDLFCMDSKGGYSLKGFDPAIVHSFGKPSVEQINEYFSIVNTGIDRDADLVQIHPLLNSQSQIYYQNESDNKLVSDRYNDYFGDIEKSFQGLRITDFPVYMQGLEFRQNSQNSDNDPRSVIISKENGKGIKTELGVQTELHTKQVVNEVDRVQYVRVDTHENHLIKSAQ